jgi:hypothetical protein
MRLCRNFPGLDLLIGYNEAGNKKPQAGDDQRQPHSAGNEEPVKRVVAALETTAPIALVRSVSDGFMLISLLVREKNSTIQS